MLLSLSLCLSLLSPTEALTKCVLLLAAANKQTTAGFGLGAIETAVEYWEASMDGCHVVMMGRFCKQSRRVDAIPDPWSGGQQGFEKVGPGVVCLHTALA